MNLYFKRLRLAILGKDCWWSRYFNLNEEILDHIERFCDEYGWCKSWLEELWEEIKKYRTYEEETIYALRNWWTDEAIKKAINKEVAQQKKVSKLVWENLFNLWI